ncbi:MAG: hypothetical protein M3505_08025 [Verrucomicrobiota bacterium]|nr:hypothetical protein [Verrucomicrobiota bacterium]
MQTARAILRRFAVKGVIWRHYLDWAIANVPFHLQPILLTVCTVFFFFFAASERRSILGNLPIVLPGSSPLINHFRAFRTLLNFSWSIAEAANYRVNKANFIYEIMGPEFLAELSTAHGAILLTAHMGSPDLGAALFAQKLNREIRMVRAPEPDRHSEQHLHSTVERVGEGAVKIAYSTDGAMLSFDLLGALRAGEIVSIQGDRIIPGIASVDGRMFGERVQIPNGPFILAQIARVPIFPLFVVRSGYRRYRIVACEPISVARSGCDRAANVAAAVSAWCVVLEEMIAEHWRQWFGFGPLFARDVIR